MKAVLELLVDALVTFVASKGAMTESRDRTVPRFSLGGTFEVLDIPPLLERSEPFEPVGRLERRRIDGRTQGRVGVRVFRIDLVRALLLPSEPWPRVLGQTTDGQAYYGPLPSRYADAWVVPQSIELYVCGRVIEGWRPCGTLEVSRAAMGTSLGYAPSMVAVLGPAEELPATLQRWFVHSCPAAR